MLKPHTAKYVPGAERSYARSTVAHDTVTVGVGDPDQHELWASHRIGARAEPVVLDRAHDRLLGEVQGWQSPALHRREVTWDGREIAITDNVDRDEVPATVRWYVPADLPMRETPQGFVCFANKGGAFELVCEEARFVVTDAPGWIAIGVPAPRKCLAARLPAGGATLRLRALK